MLIGNQRLAGSYQPGQRPLSSAGMERGDGKDQNEDEDRDGVQNDGDNDNDGGDDDGDVMVMLEMMKIGNQQLAASGTSVDERTMDKTGLKRTKYDEEIGDQDNHHDNDDDGDDDDGHDDDDNGDGNVATASGSLVSASGAD